MEYDIFDIFYLGENIWCALPDFLGIYRCIEICNKTRYRQVCRDDYVHDVHTAGLHTNDRFLLEAIRNPIYFKLLLNLKRP